MKIAAAQIAKRKDETVPAVLRDSEAGAAELVPPGIGTLNRLRRCDISCWLAAIAIATLLLTSCGQSNSIVGKWQNAGSDNPMVWEFANNGAVTEGTTHGKYTFGNDKRIKIETPFATSVYQMQVEGDLLVLTDSRGSALRFTRVK